MATTVLALTRYDKLGGSSRVRILQYVPRLKEMGLTVLEQPLFSHNDLLRLYRENRRSVPQLGAALLRRVAMLAKRTDADVVWLQQELFPFLPFPIETALIGKRRLVLDYDDANHLYYPSLRFPFGNRTKIDRLMRRADAVVVGNAMIGDYARAVGARNVQLVYSAVDTSRFDPPPPDPAKPFTVGWIGTPLTAAQSLPLIKAPLARFLSETGARCIMIGVDSHQFPDIPAERIAWSEDVEKSILPMLSLGLCPLEDSPWTRGKSGYKIIQYMAAGKPTLTSPVGIAADLVVHGRTGFHCRSEDEWYAAMTRLYADRVLCDAQGRHAREIAVAKYDSAIAARQVYGILEGSAASARHHA